MFRQLINIAQNTLTESIRQPSFTSLVFMGIFFLVIGPSLAANTMGEDDKFLIDMSMSSILFSGTFLAAFTASSVISSEIENKTVLTTVSKPVQRWVFVVGKFLGVSVSMALAYWIWSLVYLMTVRHGVMSTASHRFDGPVLTFGIGFGLLAVFAAAFANYYFRWVFTSTCSVMLAIALTLAWLLILLLDKKWQFQGIAAEFTREESFLPQVHVALILAFQAFMFLTAIAIAASTRLGQLMTIAVCLATFLLGFSASTSLKEYGPEIMPAGVAKFIGHVLPNLQYAWQTDALTQGHDVTFGHALLVTGYMAIHIIAILFVAIALFQTREVG